MKTINRIFLDMDGVFVDFVGGIHKAFGIEYDYYLWGKGHGVTWKGYPRGREGWDLYTHMGKTLEEANAKCDFDFWADLDWMPGGSNIFDAVVKCHLPTALLTTPMPNIESSAGKLRWVETELPSTWQRRVLITTVPKGILAHPDSLLIDDRSENVDAFRSSGGQAILVPRPWNDNENIEDTVGYIYQQLRLFI